MASPCLCLGLGRFMPPRPAPPPESEIEETFIKGSGPGGQKINKTNSAVQLRHIPTGIVVKSQATRSRSQNRAIARQLLAARLDELVNGAQSRTAIVSEVKRKRAASRAKKSRRKYRRLAALAEEAKEKEEEEEEEEEEEDTKEEERAEVGKEQDEGKREWR
ncbi:f372da8b-f85a-42b2-9f70-eb2013cc1d46 [Thermothielavioides terrestris]|uniref:F372da8b-f85a-42b2-9f70-eb2013cc1d46 n=1 Tax=Thermothielavioides terrestris TaxID=2587410 RepID=A0A3S4C4F4_9PEZI|nr:f372da8b-f85a-42b2-9f70-eb2013cc1d46 [Thermothielavioides terrestris]